jgi:lipoprotein-anchoring transpeptidase ErfK/SrfK
MNSRLSQITMTSFAGLAFLGASALWSGANAQALDTLVLHTQVPHTQVLAMATESDAANDKALPRRAPSAEFGEAADIPARLRRQVVDYPAGEPAGTVIVDTPNAYLYFVLGANKAIRYGIGVGRTGFTWSGTKTIERKAEWPDWHPPAEMLQRQPYLPRFMAGGPGNPLGARAMYLSGTAYRIHGTNKPSSIGTRVSSGCIRMLNADVIDLYGRTRVGTKVVVLPLNDRRMAQLATGLSPSAPKSAQIFDESMR